MYLVFKVVGGGYDEMANPMPKMKSAGMHVWKPRVQNYLQWKSHVVESCLEALKGKELDEAEQRVAMGGKPIDTGKTEMHMHIHIYWRGHAHGDPENVFGSIADALFTNDKYLALKVDYTHLDKTQQPYVTIKLQPYVRNT